MDIIDKIRYQQAQANLPLGDAPPTHAPVMLYIGCIDARLDPVDDIGIEQGKALIYRNVGAVVAGLDEQGNPLHLSEAASVEFAVNVMKVRHIVVSGHTSCGGMDACLRGEMTDQMKLIAEYLKPLEDLRNDVVAHHTHENHDTRARILEERAVRQSLKNLLTYPFVKEAVDAGRLWLHGWVIDTATKHISELNQKTGQFQAMTAPIHK